MTAPLDIILDCRHGDRPTVPACLACVEEALTAASYEGARRVLMEEPQDGEYLHLMECSGDRRQRPGTSGVSCCCPVGRWQRAEGAREVLDILDWAWGIIANVSGGDWAQQSEEWRDAAARWRDQYFKPRAHAKEPPR